MSQRSFASAEYALKKKRTRREKFLGEMERIVPWMRLIGVIEPLYPTSGRVGRQPIGVAKMSAHVLPPCMDPTPFASALW
jgi:IS5 family transposase